MRIVEIRERAIPLQANIKNSVVNFAGHTVSLLALITDVMQDGKPVAGLAFDSIGRFGQSGLLRGRFIPRLMQAQPQLLLTDDGELFGPQGGLEEGKLLDRKGVLWVIMQSENPGGHGDRAHAAAAIELAVWDLNAKLQHMPAWQHIANHFGVVPRPTMPV